MTAVSKLAADLAITNAQIALIQRHIERERKLIAELAAMRARWEREERK